MLLVVHLGVAEPKPRAEGPFGFGIGGCCDRVDLAIDQEAGGTIGPLDQ